MISLLLLFSSAFATISVTDCLDGAGTVVLNDIETDPENPTIGQNLTANLNFTVSETTDTLDCQFIVKLLSIPLFKTSLDLCEYLDCPLSEGDYSETMTFDIPSIVPPMTLGIELHCSDADSNENLCASANVTFSSA